MTEDRRQETFDVSTVLTVPAGHSFVVEGTSGGGGGGGAGAGIHGDAGQPGESAPWERYDAQLVPGRQYVVVIGAGGIGGRGAAPGQDRGEVGDAGGISYISDGELLL